MISQQAHKCTSDVLAEEGLSGNYDGYKKKRQYGDDYYDENLPSNLEIISSECAQFLSEGQNLSEAELDVEFPTGY